MSKPLKSYVKYLFKISLPAPFIISAPYDANIIRPSSLLPQGICLANKAMLSLFAPCHCPKFSTKSRGGQCKWALVHQSCRMSVKENQPSGSRVAAEACGLPSSATQVSQRSQGIKDQEGNDNFL